ncbi:hypothetical protein [Desulfovulcanus sp.]
MFRWITTIILSVCLLVSAWFFQQAWVDFRIQGQKLAQLKARVAQLQQAKREQQQQIERLRRWNALWEQVKASKFNPDDWLVIPVNIGRQLEWKDFQQLMFLVSNGNSEDAGYWFRPRQLKVTRASSPTVTKTKAEKNSPLASANMLSVSLSGDFLLKK